MSSEEILTDQADAARPSEQEPAKKVVRRVTRKKSPVVAGSTDPSPPLVKEGSRGVCRTQKRGRPKGSTGAKSPTGARVTPKETAKSRTLATG